MDETIVMRPIGVVRTGHVESKGTPIQGVFADEAEGFVQLAPEYAEGLKDLDGFSHAILIYYFHKSDHAELVGKPYLENEEHGIFSIRSPHRPNHIGFSVVRITSIEGCELRFSEVDILDGTPVLDVKPYVRQFDCREGAVSGWIEKHFQNDAPPPSGIVK
jgi:tRNA-Thr(GGU) m(6)t(6)A37 methyltransferase TsaA